MPEGKDMAQAALKEEFSFPSGGIADFYLNDEEYDAFEQEEAQKEFGNKGVAEFAPIAKRMASYGRFGDDVVIHAERGEIVVPKALIEDNPKLKDSIFGHLRELGVEDPERYVVGSTANSINPTTGMPEFFLKKLFRGVKKVFKSVGKVLKKVAPLVLPIILGPAGLGLSPVFAGAAGAGIGTLIQGGSVKDALKSALLGGATGAVFSGVSSAMGGGSFMEGVSNSLSTPVTEGSWLAKTLGTTPAAPAPVAAPSPTAATATAPATTSNVAAEQLANAAAPAPTTAPVTEPYSVPSATESAKNMIMGGGEGRLAAAKDLFMPAGPTPAQVTAAQNTAYNTAYKNAMSLPGMTADRAASVATKAMESVTAQSMGPGIARAYGPAAVLGTGVAAGAGFFSAPEDEDTEDRLSPEEYYAQDPSKFGLASFQTPVPQYATGPFVVASNYADGGKVFPRRIGGIMPNEGIPNQDSVRAMLMPGEFVMTTDAVRGLGNGSLNKGINNMYNMMRNLEARGKAFA